MTEDEAKAKWCPFSRMGQGSSNRDLQSPHWGASGNDCLGSDCAAWIWGDHPAPRVARKSSGAQLTDAPAEVRPTWKHTVEKTGEGYFHRWDEPSEEADTRRVGRCGLAR